MSNLKLFVRNPYNYDMDGVSLETGLDCQKDRGDGEPVNRTKQEFGEEVDINTIVKRFGLTGQMPENHRMPEYGDYSEVKDFRTSMQVIRDAEENFMELPAQLRARFHNDPQEFLEFCMNDENRAEATKLGLVKAEALAASIAGLPGVAGTPGTTAPGGAAAATPSTATAVGDAK